MVKKLLLVLGLVSAQLSLLGTEVLSPINTGITYGDNILNAPQRKQRSIEELHEAFMSACQTDDLFAQRQLGHAVLAAGRRQGYDISQGVFAEIDLFLTDNPLSHTPVTSLQEPVMTRVARRLDF